MRIAPGRISLLVWLTSMVLIPGSLGMLRLSVVLQARRGKRLIHDFQSVVAKPMTQRAVQDFYLRHSDEIENGVVVVRPSRIWFLSGFTRDGACHQPGDVTSDQAVGQSLRSASEDWLSGMLGAKCWWVAARLSRDYGGRECDSWDFDGLYVDAGTSVVTVMIRRSQRPFNYGTATHPECDVSREVGSDFAFGMARQELTVDISDETSPARRLHLTTINDGCFTRIGYGCTRFSELMPLVAADAEPLLRRYKEAGDQLIARNPSCRGWIPMPSGDWR